MTRVKKVGQGQIFTNPFLELLTKTTLVIHVLTYGGIITFFLYLNEMPLASTITYFGVGVLGWTFTEYMMHRYLFHLKPSKFQYMIHGVHHEYPRDRERLMMPPLPGLILTALFFGFWFLFFRMHTPAFMAGFMSGYITYTFVHYIVHAWKPIPGLKFLWTHHHKHHNPIYENKAYGVSSPFWDIVFGTMPPKGGKV